MLLRLFLCVAILAVASCASSRPHSPTPLDLTGKSIQDVAAAHGLLKSLGDSAEAQRAELLSRNYFTEAEWKLIDARKVEPGMQSLAVIAALGFPSSTSETKTKAGTIDTWYFSSSQFGSSQVILINGLVDSVTAY